MVRLFIAKLLTNRRCFYHCCFLYFTELTIGFDPSTYYVNETDMIVQVCASILNGSLQKDAVVTLSTSDGTATGLLLALPRSFYPFSNDISPLLAPGDYTAVVDAELVFSETIDTCCIDISITADQITEDTESFTADLSTDDSSVILSPQMASVDILDQDAVTITLSVTKQVVNESVGSLEVCAEVEKGGLETRVFLTLSSEDETATGRAHKHNTGSKLSCFLTQ